MPYLSIIVPCYKVQGYLRQCLDSILTQRFTDFEVIAVNDASPDHCGDILDEYAAKDDRVKAIHLAENIGLGPARNVGMEQATGEYLLFVDSDDWVAPGALQAIAEKLEETKPDLLFFDFARTDVYGSGPAVGQEHWRPPVPGATTLRESPELMGRMMTAWNKAYRRAFLEEKGLRFPPGFYEDWPVHYPALMSAERVSVLDRLCYYYRQRGGAITKSQTRRHLEAFDQIERVFAYMEASGLEEFREAMFQRAFWHYFIILKHEERLGRRDRRDFFLRMSDHYRRLRPANYRPPAGRGTWKFKLIERRAYRLFTFMRASSWPRRALKAMQALIVSAAVAAGRGALRHLRNLIYRLNLFLPLDDKLALFASYWSRLPAGNPLAIYAKVRELAPDIKAVWVVRAADAHRVPAGLPFVVDGSGAHRRLVARAKYHVTNANFAPFARKRRGAVYLQTQHGTPLKTMGLELKNYPVPARRLDFDLLMDRSAEWDYSLSSNLHSTETWERVYRSNFESLDYGYPCNDRFYDADAAEVVEVRRSLGIDPGATVILYAPTHRDYKNKFESHLDIPALVRALPPDHVVLVRAHYFYRDDQADERQSLRDRVIDVSEWPSIEDLCLAADVLVTDYSSVMFDYANLARPIVLFVDDLEVYRAVRGMYLDVFSEGPGVVASTQDELVNILVERRFEDAQWTERLTAFRARFCPWDDGRAAERVVRRVFLGETPDPPVPFEQRIPAPSPRAAREQLSLGDRHGLPA